MLEKLKLKIKDYLNFKLINKGILLGLYFSGFFILFYSARIASHKFWLFKESYPLPWHFDEWFHLQAGINFFNQELFHLSKGFHFILWLINQSFDLLSIYHLIPALWALATALTLFLIIYHKTNRHFYLAFLTIIFFASIKSNINLIGLWFFTPLTFSIPFIYLYLYLFTEGILRNRKKWLITSGVIMLFLIPIHAISVLFSLPILIIFSLYFWPQTKEALSTIIPLFFLALTLGLSFFIWFSQESGLTIIFDLINHLIFPYGWGMTEMKNSPLEVYSLIGYLLALWGFYLLITQKKLKEKYFLFWLWPVFLIFPIILYRLIASDPLIDPISILSPYQRNIYYLVLALPFLSAFGLFNLLNNLRHYLAKKTSSKLAIKIILFLFITIILFFTFKDYYEQPSPLLNKLISTEEYQALNWLAQKEVSGQILAPARILWTWHPEIGAKFFSLGPGHTEKDRYYRNLIQKLPKENCQNQKAFFKRHGIEYFFTFNPLDCSWPLIYEKENIYIYGPLLDLRSSDGSE